MARTMTTVLALVLVPTVAGAIGFMYTGMGGREHQGELMEMPSLTVQVRIDERLAVTRVDQVFRNRTDQTVEGVYEFALPPGAAITDLVLWIGDRRIQGQILEKEEARQAYEDLVSHAIDPALIEQLGDERFRLSVFPFPAGGERRVELEYMEVLKATSGAVAYTFPLRRDADVSVPVGLLQMRADVTSRVPFAVRVRDPFSAISLVERASDTTATVTMADEQVATATDLVIELEEQVDLYHPRLLSQAPAAGEDGYFALWLPPLPELATAAPAHRAVSFLVDVSSSMGGSRLAAVKEALHLVLAELTPDDLFNLVAYSSYAERFRPELVPATAANVEAAQDFVRLQGALGATSFQAALEQALQVPAPSALHHVVLLTDGRPTVGHTSLTALEVLVHQLTDGVRIHTIGVGEDVDRTFLQILAEDHFGESAFVNDGAALATQLRALLELFQRPEMTVRDITFLGTQTGELVPPRLPVLTATDEVFQVGRYNTGGDVTLQMHGRTDGQDTELAWPLNLAPAGDAPDDTARSMVARLWAYRTVLSLEAQLARLGPQDELSDRILGLGLAYRLVTSRTSLYAPDPEVVVNPVAGPGDGVASTAVADEVETRSWLGRTFVRGDQGWVDTAFTPGMPRREYRGAGPTELARFAAMGERLLVVVAGTAWEIPAQPARALLLGNAPNPFNQGTTITYCVPVAMAATDAFVTVYDLAGQIVWRGAVATVVGEHQVHWDGRDRLGRPAASGVYLCQLIAGGQVDTRRMALVR
ncbi:MAG: VIT domain-containing protein [Candidatus Latescibacterota bacterium]|jgi:Ca-activated chloride channel family protein